MAANIRPQQIEAERHKYLLPGEEVAAQLHVCSPPQRKTEETSVIKESCHYVGFESSSTTTWSTNTEDKL